MSPIALDQILAIAPAELAQQSGDALFEIKNSATLRLTQSGGRADCAAHAVIDLPRRGQAAGEQLRAVAPPAAGGGRQGAPAQRSVRRIEFNSLSALLGCGGTASAGRARSPPRHGPCSSSG